MIRAGKSAIRLVPGSGTRGAGRVISVLVLGILLGSGTADAAPASEGVSGEGIRAEIAQLINENSRKRQLAAVSLAKRLEPKLLPLLLALREGSLFVWKDPGGRERVVIGGKAQTRGDRKLVPLSDAYPKKPLKSPEGGPLLVPAADLREIRAGRRIRRAIKPYINRIENAAQLQSPDPNVRRAAATRLAREGGAGIIPALQRALGEETHWLSRHAIEEAIALIRLKDERPPIRRAAVERLGAIRALNAAAELRRLAGAVRGQAGDPDASVRGAAARAVEKIENHRSRAFLIGTVFRGLSLGSILLLMALGLAVVFGLMGVINMAHGELMMLGAYATFVIQGLFLAYVPQAYFGYYFLLALPAAFAVSAAAGFVIEVAVIRHLYGRPLETLLTTWGISLILQQAVRQFFGAQNVDVKSPAWLSGGYHAMIGVQFPYNRLFIVGLTVCCVIGTYFYLFRTRQGMRIRAVMQNREMSTCLGVASRRVDAWTFALGAGLAGLAGAALSQVGNVGPDLGQNYIVDSFMVVVTGGVGKIMGAIVAGLGIGSLTKILEPATGAVFGKVVILLLVILFLQKRPEGLFAIRTRGA